MVSKQPNNRQGHCELKPVQSSLVPTWSELQSHPDGEGHAAVVDDVQGGHVLHLVPQYEEQRVEEFREL